MRAIGTIPHDRITITIFSMNDKYQIQFEAGPMIQTYKLRHDEINGLEGIKKMVDEQFLENILTRFNEMYLFLKQAKENIK